MNFAISADFGKFHFLSFLAFFEFGQLSSVNILEDLVKKKKMFSQIIYKLKTHNLSIYPIFIMLESIQFNSHASLGGSFTH